MSWAAGLAFLITSPAVAETRYAPGFGPNPELPAPQSTFLPTMKVARATGWPDGVKPAASADLTVTSYASGLLHPRWLYVLPNGDVLVAETNAPERPKDGTGLKAWVASLFQKHAGAKVPSANRITLLRGLKPDGSAEMRTTFLENLNSPFGMTLVGNTLYVANADALVKFNYRPGDTQITAPAVKVADLPGGPINHHWTKNVIANADGTKLYVTVGSNSNVAENGMDAEVNRAGILEIDPATGASRQFASGLRNPNGLAWEPETKSLWTVVNERDEIGDNLVPDYLTSVKDGAFYGWPYSYFGQHVDERVKPQKPDLVAKAIPPDYAIGAHTASLGLAFSPEHSALPARLAHGAFIGQHGSWNRSELSGYKVIFVPFANGKPSGPPEDILTDFVDSKSDARGRPVGVAFGKDGALLVADDVGNKIWRVVSADRKSSSVKNPVAVE
ncbi:sorbosone dehydrogenase [Hyphomicrobium methylovorum]|uniref:PQQ-dependent sugar dehydrogenase n=1 Tax=Hyphomicrobium methylovorum TaxID=84 RepID=UPI0015E70825|nr:sorbosone dehydrogenase family protein [Hyphomicrobium methylovorum]MBA2126155.1 sorbosone dehydrogenase [Hyphomicrobium methylovorum]